MPLKPFLLLILLPHVTVSGISQTKINPAFTNSVLNEYRQWIKSTNLDILLTADTIEPINGKYILKLKTRDLQNWNKLTSYTDSLLDQPAADLLFRQFLFKMDLIPPITLVDVDAIDATIHI